ncbi:MAG TPA: MarR family transcriptional regulator [Dyella sp.]|nr:MarR family transcriptional regulator [Dyella sp.]
MKPAQDIALLTRAVLRLARRLRTERADPQLGRSALGMLATLHREGAMTAAQLAKQEQLQPQSLSRLIASMTKDDLIARRPHDLDGRAIILEITSKGRHALARDMNASREWLHQAMAAQLTPAEQKQLLQAAELMLRLAHKDDTAADD